MPQSVKGVTTATVTDNNDPEGLCRVRFATPDRTGRSGRTGRALRFRLTGDRRGVVLIPEIGDEVLVAFEGGDPRLPCVVGALWSASAPPPEANANGRNDRRVIQSRSGHRLAFDDGTPGSVELATSDGRKIVMDDLGVSVRDARGIMCESTVRAVRSR